MSLIDRGISHKEDPGKILLITGISGAGKTNLITKARENGAIPTGVKIVEFGDTLTSQLQKRGFNFPGKDAIRELPSEIVEENIKELVARTLTSPEKGLTIVVGHIVYEQNKMLVDLSPDYAEYGEHVQGIVPVFAYPEDVARRRTEGPRRRAPVTPEAIYTHQEKILTGAVKVATWVNKTGSNAVEVIPFMSRPNQNRNNLSHFSEIVGDILRTRT